MAKRTTPYKVASGDTGYAIAQAHGISFDSLSAANPGVNWANLQIGQVLQLPSSSSSPAQPPTASSAPASGPTINNGATVNGANAVTSVSDADGSSTGQDVYRFYQGNGSPAAGWPSKNNWISFSAMWQGVSGVIGKNCLGYDGQPQPASNTAAENQQIRDAIQAVAQKSRLDHRFILAVIMQESGGCVRVRTTYNGVTNPGLMQDHNGQGNCNPMGGSPLNPCPIAQIYQMIVDGSMGTSAGDGLVQTVNAQSGYTGAQAFYRAARAYNSGSVDGSGDLGRGVATHCYASDIANRLTGWVKAQSQCTLD